MKAKTGDALDAFVKKLGFPHKEIVEALRKLVREAAPGLKEAINPWGNPVWVGKGEVFWLIAYENHVDFGFHRGTELQDPEGLLEGTGKRFRHVKIRDPKDVRPADLKPLIQQAVALD